MGSNPVGSGEYPGLHLNLLSKRVKQVNKCNIPSYLFMHRKATSNELLFQFEYLMLF